MLFPPALAETLVQTITASSSLSTYHPAMTTSIPNQLNMSALRTWTTTVCVESNRHDQELINLRDQVTKLHQFIDWISVAHPQLPSEFKRFVSAHEVLEKANG